MKFGRRFSRNPAHTFLEVRQGKRFSPHLQSDIRGSNRIEALRAAHHFQPGANRLRAALGEVRGDRRGAIIQFERRHGFVNQAPLHRFGHVEDSAHQAEFQSAALPERTHDRTIDYERPHPNTNFSKSKTRAMRRDATCALQTRPTPPPSAGP